MQRYKSQTVLADAVWDPAAADTPCIHTCFHVAVSLLPDVNLKLFLKPGREVLQGISLVLLLVHDSM